ncbi:MAG: 6-bladed beta-propeller [Gemmatimonadaceae bacterium]|nr:6-bladed beta-propeller [Gemmatimonadaceae bacterium]
MDDESFDTDFEAVRVMRLPTGQFLVGGRKGALGLFDAGLRFVRQIGRGGAGPGEFRQPTMVLTRGDSIGIYDWALRRLTIYGPDLRVPARTVPLPEFRDAEWLEGGRILISGLITTPRQAGYPLHVVSASGALERSFGTNTPNVHRNSERELGKSIVRSPNGDQILVASTHRYEIEAWSGDLQRSRTFDRDVPWFPVVPASWQRDAPGRTAPRTELGALGADKDRGLLFATFLTAPVNWKADPALAGVQGELRAPTGPTEPIAIYLNRYYDTLLEALDPRDMSPVATTRLRGIFAPISKSPFYVTVGEAADGSLTLRLVRAEVVTAAGEPVRISAGGR